MNKRAQVWIETVLYTLIALSLIGLILGFVMPKINQTKDKILIEQTTGMMNLIDEKVNRAAMTAGNSRKIDFNIKRGELYFNSKDDKIVLKIDEVVSPYSSPGVDIKNGAVTIRTDQNQKKYTVLITLDYSYKYNLTFNGIEEEKKFNPSPTAYSILLKNKGGEIKTNLDFELINQ